MILNALNKYYEILAEDENINIPLYGYSNANVGFALNISIEGNLVDVIPLKVESNNGKKLVSRVLIVPEQKIRSSGTCPNFMCDNSTYVLGIDNKGKPSRSNEAFTAFKELHNAILCCANGKAAKAVLAFLDNWNIDKAREHPVLKDYIEEILEGSNLVFRLDGETGYLHNDIEIKEMWEAHNSKSEGDILGQCLVTGEKKPIAKLHPSIKKVMGAQSSGATIVSFNASAYESYNKENGYIAPVSKYAAFTYTTVLNYMLSTQKQRIQIGDATTVFWAESPDGIYTDLASELFNPSFDKEEDNDGPKKDRKVERLIKDVLEKAKSGMKLNDLEDINEKTKFYILGLSPNASRISIRFFHNDSFGGFITKLALHYADMEVVREYENNYINIPLWKLISETISPKSNDKSTQPLLAGEVMRSIISGSLYPDMFYNAIMLRVKKDTEIRVNHVRASIIKAYLKRKARINKNSLLEEVLTVSLNEESTNIPYLLGRLFAILEKTQKDAGNETIRIRYFTSACATPAAAFPILLKLAQHHIAKSDYGYKNDMNIEEVLNKIEKFPSNLTLEEQGLFSLGYYHQRASLWKKVVKN